MTPVFCTTKTTLLTRSELIRLFPSLIAQATFAVPLGFLLIKIVPSPFSAPAITPAAYDALLNIAAKSLPKLIPPQSMPARWEYASFALALPGYNQKNTLSLGSELSKDVKEALKETSLTGTAKNIFILTAAESAPPAGYLSLGRQAEQELIQQGGLFLPNYISASTNNLTGEVFLTGLLNTNDAYLARHGAIAGEIAQLLALCLGHSTAYAQHLAYALRVANLALLLTGGLSLWKPGPLTKEEWRKIKDHPPMGANIGLKIGLPTNIAKGLLEFREAWEGSGYPQGLTEEEISSEGQILAMASAWGALLLPRPYRRAFNPAAALNEIKLSTGKLFAPKLAALAPKIEKSRHLAVWQGYN